MAARAADSKELPNVPAACLSSLNEKSSSYLIPYLDPNLAYCYFLWSKETFYEDGKSNGKGIAGFFFFYITGYRIWYVLSLIAWSWLVCVLYIYWSYLAADMDRNSWLLFLLLVLRPKCPVLPLFSNRIFSEEPFSGSNLMSRLAYVCIGRYLAEAMAIPPLRRVGLPFKEAPWAARGLAETYLRDGGCASCCLNCVLLYE